MIHKSGIGVRDGGHVAQLPSSSTENAAVNERHMRSYQSYLDGSTTAVIGIEGMSQSNGAEDKRWAGDYGYPTTIMV
jgi:hypothetical protein